ncbi:MAG: DUF2314 domain-containing protein [Tabrizicola sp.]|jgi:uncharacterized protein YegJ (DUF2314 family)|nr:DUF2314 domain-containing protein [Tabrizicola sp.]
MRLKRLLIPAVIAALALTAPAVAQDPVIDYATDDPQMNTAIAEAQATLPLFLAHALDAQGKGSDVALVKVGFPTVDSSEMDVEHIWVSLFARHEDGSFTGMLANEPVALGDLRAGDEVAFTQAMISDWHMTAPSGLFWGSYTSRVMYEQGAFGDTPFDQLFEADPVPAGWK